MQTRDVTCLTQVTPLCRKEYPPKDTNLLLTVNYITRLQVNHLNPVDEAMIADASCRLVAGEHISFFLLLGFFLVVGEPLFSCPEQLNR